jgi:tripartite-type tricarboxylate transporter receptor subunit TctC
MLPPRMNLRRAKHTLIARWPLLLTAGLTCLPCGAPAREPATPVRLVVPYPISGPTDIRGTSRLTKTYKLLAQNAPPAVSDTLGRLVTDALVGAGTATKMERHPGGMTARGAQLVARAEADGRTLLLGSNATMLINPRYFGGLGYDPVRDFVLAAPLAVMPFVLLVGPGVPPTTPVELAHWLRGRPGEINYASSGDGSTGHIAGEMFRRLTGTSMMHVGYNGGLAALNGLATGQVSVMFAALPLALPYLGRENFTALGLGGRRRFPTLPDLRTLEESGLPGFDAEGWFGVFAPGRTPPNVVAHLHARIAPAVASGSVRAAWLPQGLEPASISLEQFATRINTDAERWAPIVEASRIHVQPGSS